MHATAWAESAMAVLVFLGVALARATLWLLLVLLAAWLLRRGSATTRRRIWTAAVIGLLLLPAGAAVVPSVELAVLPNSPASPPPALAPWFAGPAPAARASEALLAGLPLVLPPATLRETAAAPAATTSPIAAAPVAARLPPAALAAPALVAIYVSGLLLVLLRLAHARRHAADLLRGAHTAQMPWPQAPGVDLRETDQVELPLTVGSFAPVVLVPTTARGWPAGWRTAALAHEAAHVRSRDPLWQLLAEIACALYWVHPLVHLAARQLKVERELAADDAALATGTKPSDYAQLLVELACVPCTPPRTGAVVPLLTPAGLKARLLGVLDPGRARRPGRGAGIALVGLGMLTFLPLALALPVQRDPDASSPYVHGGALIGRVIDSRNQQPVQGAEVAFRFRGLVARTEMALTDAQGWFRYPHAAPPVTDFDVYARKGTLAARNNVLAMPYGTTLPITLAIAPAHTLSGTLRDADQRPVAGATVRIIEDSMTGPAPGSHILARSNAAGDWRIDGVLYGEFRLLVQAPWGVATTGLAIVEDHDVQTEITTLPRDWEITGWLQDESGRRLPGVRIEHGTMRAYATSAQGLQLVQLLPGQRYLDWDESAADGSFRLLRRGRPITVETQALDGTLLYAHVVVVDGKRLATVTRADGRKAIDMVPDTRPFALTLKRTGRVSGQVLGNDGAPAAGAHVLLSQAVIPQTERPSVQADGRGRFTLAGVPPATDVQLLALPAQGQSGPWPRGTPILLRPGEHLENLTLTLPPR